MSLLLVLLSLFFLFLSKGWLTWQMSRLVHRLGGGHRGLIIIWSLIFLPGTVIHELSHFFFAILTGARTGKIEILPQFLEEDWEDESRGRSVALGYVQTQKLNPVQGFLVGTAPFIVGLILLVWLSSLLRQSYLSQNIYLFLLQGYLFFTLSNSFFPSWSDIRQTLPLVIITAVSLLVLWILGVQIIFGPPAQIISLANTLTTTISISIALNLVLTLLIFLTNKICPHRRP